MTDRIPFPACCNRCLRGMAPDSTCLNCVLIQRYTARHLDTVSDPSIETSLANGCPTSQTVYVRRTMF